MGRRLRSARGCGPHSDRCGMGCGSGSSRGRSSPACGLQVHAGRHLHPAALPLRAERRQHAVVGPQHDGASRVGVRADRVVGQGAVSRRTSRHHGVRVRNAAANCGGVRRLGPVDRRRGGRVVGTAAWCADDRDGRRDDGALRDDAQRGHRGPRRPLLEERARRELLPSRGVCVRADGAAPCRRRARRPASRRLSDVRSRRSPQERRPHHRRLAARRSHAGLRLLAPDDAVSGGDGGRAAG